MTREIYLKATPLGAAIKMVTVWWRIHFDGCQNKQSEPTEVIRIANLRAEHEQSLYIFWPPAIANDVAN